MSGARRRPSKGEVPAEALRPGGTAGREPLPPGNDPGDLITDLKQIEALADELWDENHDFRVFLKQELDWSDRKLDALVQSIAAEVTAAIDCTQCANCCVTMMIKVSQREVNRLAGHQGISPREFEERYLATGDGSEKLIAATPCPFLEGKLCSVYEDRPADCRSFPHLHKRDFRSRTMGMLQRAGICPIVFNTLERLKQRLGFEGD